MSFYDILGTGLGSLGNTLFELERIRSLNEERKDRQSSRDLDRQIRIARMSDEGYDYRPQSEAAKKSEAELGLGATPGRFGDFVRTAPRNGELDIDPQGDVNAESAWAKAMRGEPLTFPEAKALKDRGFNLPTPKGPEPEVPSLSPEDLGVMLPKELQGLSPEGRTFLSKDMPTIRNFAAAAAGLRRDYDEPLPKSAPTVEPGKNQKALLDLATRDVQAILRDPTNFVAGTKILNAAGKLKLAQANAAVTTATRSYRESIGSGPDETVLGGSVGPAPTGAKASAADRAEANRAIAQGADAERVRERFRNRFNEEL